ncbi:hypothetical protein C5167_027092 [Papaver somniferum]|nr:hypothetical protein C5167_027092 [Papaver somniferum]
MGNLDSLPVEIILKILKGFDIDSVIQYRLVSRTSEPGIILFIIVFSIISFILKFVSVSEDYRVRQGIMDAQRNSESGKLLHLKKITDADLRRYLNLLNRKETVGSKVGMLKRLRQRRQYVLQELRERLRFPY